MGGTPGPVLVWETLSCHEECIGVGASRARPATYFVYFEDEVMRRAAFLQHVQVGVEEVGMTDGHTFELTPTGAFTRLDCGSETLLVEYHSLRLLRLNVQQLGSATSVDALDALDPCILWAPSTLLSDFLRSVTPIVQPGTARRECS